MIFLPRKKAMKIKHRLLKEGQENLKKQIDKSFEEYDKAQETQEDETHDIHT